MTTIDKRKEFLINTAYVALLILITWALFKFVFKYLSPFVIGFVIALILKPIIRKLDALLGENKVVSVVVMLLFYVVVILLMTYLIISLVAFVQNNIPYIETFLNGTVLPMVSEMFAWFEMKIQALDPQVVDLIEKAMVEVMVRLEALIQVISSTLVVWVTSIIKMTPGILVSFVLAVVSSFFFSMDYQLVVNTLLGLIPNKTRVLVIEAKNNFSRLIGQYFIAYGKLMFLTFLELSLGFIILRVSNPIFLAASIALVDILPVLGTGTILLPWAVYEIILGKMRLGLGVLILYGIITVVRYILEPRVIGKQIGLHPLITLISIYLGVKLFGFLGLFAMPIFVTIAKDLYDEGKIDPIKFFKAEKQSLLTPKNMDENDSNS